MERYYVIKLDYSVPSKAYRRYRTKRGWTADRDLAYPFASKEIAEAIADRERRLLHPRFREYVTIGIEAVEP